MSKRGAGSVAANGSSIKNYGEKKVVGHTDGGEGESTQAQRADVKKCTRSVRKMNLRGNAVVLDGKRSYTQNDETGKKTRIGYEDGQYVTRLWLQATEEEKQNEKWRKR